MNRPILHDLRHRQSRGWPAPHCRATHVPRRFLRWTISALDGSCRRQAGPEMGRRSWYEVRRRPDIMPLQQWKEAVVIWASGKTRPPVFPLTITSLISPCEGHSLIANGHPALEITGHHRRGRSMPISKRSFPASALQRSLRGMACRTDCRSLHTFRVSRGQRSGDDRPIHGLRRMLQPPWVFPRGMKRSGEAGKNSLQWTSKYGSVIAPATDISTTDALNEAGLSSAHCGWLTGISEIETAPHRAPSIAAWAGLCFR